MLGDPYFASISKAELHAHLHGSIRPSTLHELLSEKRAKGLLTAKTIDAMDNILSKGSRDLSECFRIFDLIHQAVETSESVYRITREMIEDCAADGVRYLEIRSTPRALLDGPRDHEGKFLNSTTLLKLPTACKFSHVYPTTSESQGCCPISRDHQHETLVNTEEDIDAQLSFYIETIVRAIYDASCYCDSRERPPIVVRFIVSINRAHSPDAARNILRCVRNWASLIIPTCTNFPIVSVGSATPAFQGVIVGIDVSGDPTKGHLETLLSIIDEEIRAPEVISPYIRTTCSKLKVTVHAGEVLINRAVQGCVDARISDQETSKSDRVMSCNVCVSEDVEDTETETRNVLKWRPERLGHMCCLSCVSEDYLVSLASNDFNWNVEIIPFPISSIRSESSIPIPIEVCGTSNAFTLGLESIRKHPQIPVWIQKKYLIAPCTDDYGVFLSLLSNEYKLLHDEFGINAVELREIARRSFEYAFIEEENRKWLLDIRG